MSRSVPDYCVRSKVNNTGFAQKVNRYKQDPIRLETGRADRTPEVAVKAVRLG
jgi:hypothetical protein